MLVLSMFIFCANSSNAQAQSTGDDTNTPKYSNEFLSLGLGARNLAMGNASIVSTNGVNSGYWNPAGLMHLNNLQVGAMHAEWFAGIAKYDHLGAALPISDGKRAIGLNVIRFAIDDIPNTLYILEPDGSVNYDNISSFSAADYAFLLSYGQSLGKLRVGGTAKVIYRKVGSFATAWGLGLDLGAHYDITEGLTVGLMLRDFPRTYNTWSFGFTEEEQEILALTENVIPLKSVELTAMRIILGASYKLDIGEKMGLLSELNFDITTDGRRNTLIKTDAISIDPRLGLEFDYDDFVFLRLGMNNIQQIQDDTNGETYTSIQPNVGLGLKIKEIYIDYAFTGLNRVSDGIFSNVISLKLDIVRKGQNTRN